MNAPPAPDERLIDEALAWHAAMDADDADWDGYTEWLEKDPRHRAASDAVALTDRIVDDHRERLRGILPESPDEMAPRRRSRIWPYGAVAAAVALAVGLPLATRSKPDIAYENDGSGAKHLALAEGVAVDLAPGSALLAKRGDANQLELARGEAYFDVAHDPSRTLAIKAGGFSIRDIGTRFGVNVSGRSLRVGVAEGAVSVLPEGGPRSVDVTAGQQLVAPLTGGTGRVRPISMTAVGGFRQGQLSYNDAPLETVASDLSRYVGKRVDLDADLAGRRFSGVLRVGDGSKLLPTLATVMGLSYQADGDRVRLSASTARRDPGTE